MDATRSSEMLIYNKPTRRHIPEDGILQTYVFQHVIPSRMADRHQHSEVPAPPPIFVFCACSLHMVQVKSLTHITSTYHHIPEDCNLNIYHNENLQYHK
jgi:hypothetical protein